MATRKAKMGRPRKAAKVRLDGKITVRCTKSEKAAAQRVAAQLGTEPSPMLRADLQRRIEGRFPLGEYVGQVLVINGAVWWSPGLGQWVKMAPDPKEPGVMVKLSEDPYTTIRAVMDERHGPF